MAPPPGYVGYTAIQEPDLATCVNTYANRNNSPSQVDTMAFAAKSVTDKIAGFESGFSLFHLIIQLNNLNGKAAVPAGNLIVGRMTDEFTREQPCDAPKVGPIKRVRYEKFSDGVDVQFSITGCKSRLSFTRVMDYAIMPDPAPATPVPAKEHAWLIGKATATKGTFELGTPNDKLFDESITLRLTLVWTYDNCGDATVNKLDFKGETLDPANGAKVTWTLSKTYGK